MHPVRESPSEWVSRFTGVIPQGLVLDLACGNGRHARLLADAGHRVLAVDRNAAVLAELASASIEIRCIDLETGDAATRLLSLNTFAGIIVTNYLHRPLLPMLFSGLVEGGVLIYDTFAQGNGAFGKPASPAFLLQSGELLDAVAQAPCKMHVLAYEDGFIGAPRPAMRQRLCAIRSSAEPAPEALKLSSFSAPRG
ncbi:class I SAM-dependent methyltransferase [Actimicrobium antarcticum]|uniref:Class I SAM-dependent methyltransferase n=1 Tax=Actimicrobium antarcticum TaxID=1051899 RepID=A0ABP7SIY3_9BURK